MRWALGILAILALGVLIGRASAPSAGGGDAFTRSPGPSREIAGVGVGYAHTRAGAILAVARYQQALSDVAILRPGALRRRIDAVATPDFAATMLAANTPGTERLAAGALGEGLRHHVQTIFAGVPIGYRVLSYSPERARILNWGFTLLGNASAVEPSAYFGVARIEVAWQAGDWKIANSRAAFGPTPRLATPRGPSEGFSVIDLAQRLHSYGIAP
jgi:hypothetical protein